MDKNPKNTSVLFKKLMGVLIQPSLNRIELIGLKFSLNKILHVKEATSGGVTQGVRNIARKNPFPGRGLISLTATYIASATPSTSETMAKNKVLHM